MANPTHNNVSALSNAADNLAHLIGRNYVHRNGHIYEVSGIAYDGAGELVVLHYNMDSKVDYVRTAGNFLGIHTDTGLPRFMTLAERDQQAQLPTPPVFPPAQAD